MKKETKLLKSDKNVFYDPSEDFTPFNFDDIEGHIPIDLETEDDLEKLERVQGEILEQQLWDENFYEDVSTEGDTK